MANPTKEELLETLTRKGLNQGEQEEVFVRLFGVKPGDMRVSGPLPDAGPNAQWLRPFQQDVAPTQIEGARRAAQAEAKRQQAAAEQQQKEDLAAEEAAYAPLKSGDPQFSGLDAELEDVRRQTQGRLNTGVAPAVAGAVAGAADSLKNIFSYTTGDAATTEKEIADSFARQEEFIRSRVGQSEYENFYHDAMDLITIMPNIGALMYDTVSRGDSFAKAREITRTMATDSATVYPFLYNNWDRSYKASPLASILAAIPAMKAIGALGQLGANGARLTQLGERIHAGVNKGLDRAVDIGPTIKAKTKFRRTGDEVTPGIYEHSLGDSPVTYRDILRSGVKGAGAGLVAGGTPTAAVAAFVAGAGMSALMGKLNRTGLGAQFANTMGRLLNGLSSNMKVSHELAMRNLFARGPEAESKLQAIGAQIAKRLQEGSDVLDGELMTMAQNAFPDLIANVEFGKGGRRYDIRKDSDVAARPRRRRKLSDELEADLKSAGDMLQGLLGSTRSRRTMMLMDDLLSDGSVQFGRVDDVRLKALELVEADIGRKLTTAERADLAKTMETVSNTPFHREAGINLNMAIGDRQFDLRNLVTRAHRQLSPKRRKAIIAGLAADIITSNRNQVRKQSFARAAAQSSDDHLRRIGLDPEELAKMNRYEAEQLYALRVAQDVITSRGSVPLVGPTGLQMQSSGRYLRSLAEEDPSKLFAALEEKLGRPLTTAEQKIATRRAKEIAGEMEDSNIRDIADEGARAAEGYYGDTERGSIYNRMEELIDNDFLDETDINKVKSFFQSVDNSKNVIADNRSMRGPLTSAFSWLHTSADHGGIGRMNRLLSAHIKSNYTTRNVNAHINNSMSNIGLLSYDRGVDPASVLRGIVRDTSGYWNYTKGRAKLSDRDRRLYKQIDRAGFAAGDITMAEIQNLSRMENLPERLRTNSTLDRALRSGVATGLKAVDDVAAGVYRLGDVGPKIHESMHSMRNILRRIDNMENGQTWEFRTSPVSSTVVTRRGNGLFIGKKRIADFVTKDGKVQAVGDKLDNLVGQHGRLRANERFFDYRDRPGILRFLDKIGGPLSYVNPYLTWAWKATGVGDRGLFSVVNQVAPEYRTNKLSSLLKEEGSAAAKWYRRAIAAQGLRSAFSDNPGAMRDALGYSDVPGAPLSVLINRMASPDVVEVRNMESMNPFSREFLKYETLLGIGQDLMMDTGLLRKDVQARRRAKQFLGETNIAPRLLQLGMITGGPAHQVAQRLSDGRGVSARDMLAVAIGQTPALGLTATVQATGLGEDSAYTLMQERLPESARPDAADFYFRKMFNYGWDRQLVLNKRGRTNGRISKYFAGIKKRVTENYYADLINDFKKGKLDLAELKDAERLAQKAYRDRFNQVNEAFELVTGRRLPAKLRAAPKLDYKKARRQ